MKYLGGLGLCCVLVVACGGSEEPYTDPATVELGGLPETPAGRKLAWVLHELNNDGFSIKEIEDHFDSTLLTSLPAPSLQRALFAISDLLSPMTFQSVVGDPEPGRIIGAVESGDGRFYTWKIRTSEAAPNRIIGIFYHAAPNLAPRPTPDQLEPPPEIEPENPPSDWDIFGERLGRIPPTVGFLAAEIGAQDCSPIASRTPDEAMAVGSTFKLFVLTALVEAIRSGRTWEEPLAIQEAHKSLPTGLLHLEEPGTKFSLQEMAEEMITHSDNTATDHLLYSLGRTTVEQTLPSASSDNRPLLATREMFLLKLYVDPTTRNRWIGDNEAKRRSYLDTELSELAVLNVITPEVYYTWRAPLLIQEVEWFFSANELCQVMVRLRQDMETPAGAPVRAILSENAGLTFQESWSYIGFKGGSEPGVLSLTWIFERSDGRWFLLSLTLNDTADPIDEGAAVHLSKWASELLYAEP